MSQTEDDRTPMSPSEDVLRLGRLLRALKVPTADEMVQQASDLLVDALRHRDGAESVTVLAISDLSLDEAQALLDGVESYLASRR